MIIIGELRVHGKHPGYSREALRMRCAILARQCPRAQNVLENMVVTAQTNMRRIYRVRYCTTSENGSVLVAGTTSRVERELIRNTLAAVGGNHPEAAVMLRYRRRTLYHKITEYSLR